MVWVKERSIWLALTAAHWTLQETVKFTVTIVSVDKHNSKTPGGSHLTQPSRHKWSHLLYSYLEWTSRQINNYYYPIILFTIEFHKFLCWNQEYLFKATIRCCWAMRKEWLKITFNTFPQFRRIQRIIFKYTKSGTLYLFTYHLS